jgi:hypothetical protein
VTNETKTRKIVVIVLRKIYDAVCLRYFNRLDFCIIFISKYFDGDNDAIGFLPVRREIQPFTLKVEATCSSETSDLTTTLRRRHMPEDNIIYCYRRENFRSYKSFLKFLYSENG